MKLIICLESYKGRETNGYYLAEELSNKFNTKIVYGSGNIYIIKFLEKISFKLRIPLFFNFYNFRILFKTFCFNPDLVLISKGNYIWPCTLLILKFLKKKVVCWSNDNYRFKHNRSLFLEYSLGLYDKILYHKPRDLKYLEKFNKKNNIKLLIHSYSPRYHYPEYSKEKSNIEILFIGTCETYRDSILANLALDGYKMHVQGTRWQNSKLKKVISEFKLKNCNLINKNTNKSEYRILMSSSKIVLNFFRRQNNDEINSRVIESLACSAISLCEYSKYSYKIFKKDKCINFFKDDNELREKIKKLLNLQKNEINTLRKKTLKAVQEKKLDFYNNIIMHLN